MVAYYNEFDPGAAAWLRELIRRGLIADGVVDERDIRDVEPADLRGFAQCHFFAGIGGWSKALRLVGWGDDRPVWTGSPPCQPFSVAGARLGVNDDRHLAPHWIELVAACRPTILFGEQVASAAVFGKAAKRARVSVEGVDPLEWAWLDDLFDRLETARYACGASDIPAAGVGAPHIRQRTFFGAIRLADADDAGSQGRCIGGNGADQWTAGASGVACGLADANGGKPWKAGGLQSGGEYGLQSQGGGTERLADAPQRGCGEKRPFVARSLVGDFPEGWPAGRDAGRAPARTNAPDSPWGTADWLYSRDGKWRPVESGTFPLAHGVSARVGRLRGYGNAIVPQAAAEFIRAFDEVTR